MERVFIHVSVFGRVGRIKLSSSPRLGRTYRVVKATASEYHYAGYMWTKKTKNIVVDCHAPMRKKVDDLAQRNAGTHRHSLSTRNVGSTIPFFLDDISAAMPKRRMASRVRGDTPFLLCRLCCLQRQLDSQGRQKRAKQKSTLRVHVHEGPLKTIHKSPSAG